MLPQNVSSIRFPTFHSSISQSMLSSLHSSCSYIIRQNRRARCSFRDRALPTLCPTKSSHLHAPSPQIRSYAFASSFDADEMPERFRILSRAMDTASVLAAAHLAPQIEL